MTPRDAETLADLVSDRAGKRGSSPLTFEQLSERSVDEVTGYRPSPNLLWKVAGGQEVKVNPALVRAIAAGLGLPLERVQVAAARQYLGWHVTDPFDTPAGDDDEVVRVVHRPGVTGSDLPLVEADIEESRRRDAGGE